MPGFGGMGGMGMPNMGGMGGMPGMGDPAQMMNNPAMRAMLNSPEVSEVVARVAAGTLFILFA